MKKVYLFCLLPILCTVVSCGNSEKKGVRTDTETSGFTSIATEDCFAPIIKEEIAVFEGLNKGAAINVIYGGEPDILDLIIKDSIRFVVAARDLTEDEKTYIKESNKQLQPRSLKVAVDGIALIVDKANTDSLMSLSTLKKIMTGEITSWKQINPQSKYDKISVFFDNPRSSTVRFIQDSICGDKPLYDGLRALPSNPDVIEKVTNTPGSLGLIGVNWISNPNDSTNLSFIDNIKVVALSREEIATTDNSSRPFPYQLAMGEYPLRRDIYAILTDLRGTLPTGFYKFITGDRGQRIILKAGLIPANRPTRLISVKESFDQ